MIDDLCLFFGYFYFQIVFLEVYFKGVRLLVFGNEWVELYCIIKDLYIIEVFDESYLCICYICNVVVVFGIVIVIIKVKVGGVQVYFVGFFFLAQQCVKDYVYVGGQ